MRILIDLQGAQTASRFRGIGRYAMSLAKSIVHNKGEHEVIVVLNGLLYDSIESIRASFEGVLAQENIRVWYSPYPVLAGEPGNESRREVAELIREAYIKNLQPDVILITSLFEGYVDNAVTSIGKYDKKTPVCVVFYDLIPLLNSQKYLDGNPTYNRFYRNKIDDMQRSKLLFSISESSRAEAVTNLGLNEDCIFNISSAIDDFFVPKVYSDIEQVDVMRLYGIEKSFVLYTGGADERKNLPRLIEAFSLLHEESSVHYQLVLAGKIVSSEIPSLDEAISKAGLAKKDVVFTGYIPDEDLVKLYNLCELFVFPSWHEGFGLPVLEAMSCGAPTIGSNTSSIPEVIGRQDALFDPFEISEIAALMTRVLKDQNFREDLSSYGIVRSKQFSWDKVAKCVFKEIEAKYCSGNYLKVKSLSDEIKEDVAIKISKLKNIKLSDKDLAVTSFSVGRVQDLNCKKNLFLDVSELVRQDARTGIQRVTRSILSQFNVSHGEGYCIEPVYADESQLGYRYARNFISKLSNQKENRSDEFIEYSVGDIFLGLDLQPSIVPFQEPYLKRLRNDGVKIFFIVYDLLPVLLSESFPSSAKAVHEKWLKSVANYDGAFCISKSVAEELSEWIKINVNDRQRSFLIDWFHLGADIKNSIPSKGLDANSVETIKKLKSSFTFLMVGTVEPRKGQDQVLEAFDLLWSQGCSVNLVIVGKQGWLVDTLAERLRQHPQRDKHLLWLEGISDEYLEKLYEASSCLIAASRGEGFGLPLIEAAQYNLPIIARDIPVFREVAGKHAFYFESSDSQGLAKEISTWLELYKTDKHIKSDVMPWLTWEKSAEQLKVALFRGKPMKVHLKDT